MRNNIVLATIIVTAHDSPNLSASVRANTQNTIGDPRISDKLPAHMVRDAVVGNALAKAYGNQATGIVRATLYALARAGYDEMAKLMADKLAADFPNE